MEKQKTTNQKEGEVKVNSNVAAALAYVLGLLSGVLVYLMAKDSDRFTKFHGMQSILLAFTFTVVQLVLYMSPFFFSNFFQPALNLLYVILSIILIMKAYKGEKYKLPLLGDLAETYSKAK